MESVLAFTDPQELENTKIRLRSFLAAMASELQSRLPENIKILKKIESFDARHVLGNGDSRAVSEIAAHFRSLGGEDGGIDVSAVESEWRRLRHTSLKATITTPLLQFWSEVASLKNDDNLVFPSISRLASILLCLPVSNATVERVFSIMTAVKTKLRNKLAVPMVEAIITIRSGLKRRGETCSNFKILPGMMERFNSQMYDHIRAREAGGPARAEGEVEEVEDDGNLEEILNDVEAAVGQPVFFTF